MKKKDRLLVIILIALVVIVIVGLKVLIDIITENDAKKGNKNNYSDIKITINEKIDTKYKPSIINKEYNRLTNDEAKAIDASIDYVIECINERKYDILYQMVTVDYAKLRFNNIDKFKVFIDESFEDKQYECKSYELSNNKCSVLLREKDINSSAHTKEIQLYNFKTESTEDTIIFFEDLKRIDQIESGFNIDEIQFVIKYLLDYGDKTTLVIDIKNGRREELSINFSESNLIKIKNGYEYDYNAEQMEDIIVKANQAIETEIAFNYTNTFYSPETLEAIININGKQYGAKIPLVFSIEDLNI